MSNLVRAVQFSVFYFQTKSILLRAVCMIFFFNTKLCKQFFLLIDQITYFLTKIAPECMCIICTNLRWL